MFSHRTGFDLPRLSPVTSSPFSLNPLSRHYGYIRHPWCTTARPRAGEMNCKSDALLIYRFPPRTTDVLLDYITANCGRAVPVLMSANGPNGRGLGAPWSFGYCSTRSLARSTTSSSTRIETKTRFPRRCAFR